ncbi:MAG: MBL fold metallo-hydrolase [Oscillospiraceae bacterium]|nr:MBL fold metallo-hydrolase [Oscillospiraceae bacterium]
MKVKFLTKKIFIINDGNEKGMTTGGIISESGTILIGCDDRLIPEVINSMGLPEVTAILCCDYRRSANAGILNFDGSVKYINENFYGLLTQPELWWDNPQNRWHIYKLRPDDDILPYGAHNINKITDNEDIIIGDIKITALLTPGDTDYSMSYLIENESIKVIFCGGLLYKGGKIPYLYRLTKDMLNRTDNDYHGYLGGIPGWKKSLDIISHADVLVPYLGGVIDNPKADIDMFNKNIDEYYGNYADISSMNNLYPECLNADTGTKMNQAQEKDFPEYVKYIGNQCNILCSKNGNAVAIDCGGTDVTDRLVSMIKQGEIKSVDALYITHYHDDHVDGCDYFRKYFDCPIYADEVQADVLKNPMGYRLPCISPVSVDVTPLCDGYSWRWQEFELTSFAFPGQSLYHGGLMVKNINNCEIIFFAGDAFTPGGIDDYCAYNRNLLTLGEGFFRCVNILKKYKPDYIINQHKFRAFSFTPGQLDYMEKNLTERINILSKLSVWDNINYAIDEYFVMAYPYEQDENNTVKFLISDYAENIKCEIVPPKHTNNNKRIYGIRVYISDIYVGQKSCFIVNCKS